MSRRAAAAGGDSWQRGGWRRWPLRRHPCVAGGAGSGSKGGGWDERRGGGGWQPSPRAALAAAVTVPVNVAASPAIATVLAGVLVAADAGECDWATEKPSSASPAVSQTHHGYFSGCAFATHSPFPPACFPGCVFPPPTPPVGGEETEA